jgi:two-component system, sensor histidine kinase
MSSILVKQPTHECRTNVSSALGDASSKIESLKPKKSSYAELLEFFWEPSPRLDQSQHLLLERRALDALARRSTLWLAILLFASIPVMVWGSPEPSPIIPGFSTLIWCLGLWALAPLHAYLLRNIIRLPKDIHLAILRGLQRSWYVWLTIIALWWFLGSWTLHQQRWTGQPQQFELSRNIFVFLTLSSQAIPIILYAPSQILSLIVLIIGFFIPFWINVALFGNAFPNRGPLVINTCQVVAYCIIGWVISLDHWRNRAKEILLEAERSRAEAEHSRANHFIAAISHDLRQPLATLALKLATLKDNANSAEAMRDIQLLQQQTLAIENMVNGTLDLSRLASGTWEVHVREVSLPHLLEKIGSDLRIEAYKKNLTLKITSIPYMVKTDPIAFERIIRNLIGNAIRYTPDISNSGPGHVHLECQLEGQFVRVSVIDNGVGIPGNRLPDIFKEYVQLSNPERDRNKGLGLGLSIVKGLATLLDHRLVVESKLGEGTKVSLYAPLIGKIPPELLVEVDDSGNISDLIGMVVVLIEDEKGPRDALRERLIEWGCYVVDGESAEEVIAELKHGDVPGGPDFILSDFRLREGQTGLDAIAAVRKETKLQIPAAIWTAETAPNVFRQIAEEGFQRFSKPPNEVALFSVLKQNHPSERKTPQAASL